MQDLGCPDATLAAQLTDHVASIAIAWDAGHHTDVGRLAWQAGELLQRICVSGLATVRTCEGFAYYALHPLDYADLLHRTTIQHPHVIVIGLRSIGTTLSAVVAAKLRDLRLDVKRTTVRPAGHPYKRRCEFAARQAGQIRSALGADALFLVCDEGPGRSGSSLLSVAEALELEGVPQNRILLLCSHSPDVGALCAPDAMRRWARYGVMASGPTRRLPSEAGEYSGGGEWRKRFIQKGQTWPACWPRMERVTYLSRDRTQLLKFEGHGHYGEGARSRNQALAASGFGCPYRGQALGFGRHVLREGRMAQPCDLNGRLLTHMAEYCAWRAKEFAAADANAQELETMARVNLKLEFGGVPELDLPLEKPVIVDGRMQPYQWLCTADGRWLKLDAATHGDDHFFPGPCDIAWDLAGAIVEWNLETSARTRLLNAYRRLSGDNASLRIHDYVTAYATFRLAWSQMAADSVEGSEERDRLASDYRRYRAVAEAHKRRAPY